VTLDKHSFHSSTIDLIAKSDKEVSATYQVGSENLTLQQVRETPPMERTVAHWAVLVDWDLHRQRPYVIVDPYDPEGLLYLTRSEYLGQVKVCASNDLTLIVVARPGSRRPAASTDSKSSQNSPPHSTISEGDELPFSSERFFRSRESRMTWKNFLDLRNYVSRKVEIQDGMVAESEETLTRTVLAWARELLHYSAVTTPERRLQGINPFAKSLANDCANNGLALTSKRLKAALFAVYSYLAGNPLTNTAPLGVGVKLSHGLPTMIPAPFRNEIRKGNLTWIRIWVSLLNSYRSFKVKTPDPETAYVTIRKDHPDLSQEPLWERWQYFCKEIFPIILENKFGDLPAYEYKSNNGLIVRSAAVNLSGSSSLLGIILDAKAWNKQPRNYPMEWFKLHKDVASAEIMRLVSDNTHFGHAWPFDRAAQAGMLNNIQFYNPSKVTRYPPTLIRREDKVNGGKPEYSDPLPRPVRCSDAVEQVWMKPFGANNTILRQCQAASGIAGGLIGHAYDASRLAKSVKLEPTDHYDDGKTHVGRLFNFDAPGGKLRTVAICDYWSQKAAKSVHDHLFKILKMLRGNDATFDQQGVVDAYWKAGFKPHWSYDLSAATDSIPLALYIECLAPFLRMRGETYENARERAELWAKLMTDRDFAIPSPRKDEEGYTGENQYRTIRYNTGQPMGAYSSWASMALVHHCLVQFSSWISEMKPVGTKDSHRWFDTYLVLGDDVDIARCPVTAKNYTVVCAAFQIKIGLVKSLQSNANYFEFANQRFCEEGNISPLSLTEEATSAQSWNRRVEFASRIASRFGVDVNEHQLVRFVTTARQWTALIPELSGMRTQTIYRLLRFILLNPLKPTWFKEAELNIDSVKIWLANLQEVVLASESKSSWIRFERILVERLKATIQTDVKQRLDTIPQEVVYYSHDPRATNILKLLGEPASKQIFMPGRRYVAPNAVESWTYIEYCVNKHNRSLRRDLRQFELNNWKLLSLKQHLVTFATNPNEEAAFLDGSNHAKDVAYWIKLYLELGNFPKPIVINNDNLASSLQGARITRKEEVEHLDTLLKVIIPTLVETLGIRIAGVPYFSIPGLMGGSLSRMLKRLLNDFNAAVKARALDPNPFGLLTRWFSGDTLLPLCQAYRPKSVVLIANDKKAGVEAREISELE
jgi:hypothetical protein